MSVETKTLSKEISEIFWREGYTLATAESCTAGNVAAIITAIPGSSRFYKGGIIAYSDEVKKTHLYVNAETLEQHGAVSEETVVEMVKGAIKRWMWIMQWLHPELPVLAEEVRKNRSVRFG